MSTTRTVPPQTQTQSHEIAMNAETGNPIEEMGGLSISESTPAIGATNILLSYHRLHSLYLRTIINLFTLGIGHWARTLTKLTILKSVQMSDSAERNLESTLTKPNEQQKMLYRRKITTISNSSKSEGAMRSDEILKYRWVNLSYTRLLARLRLVDEAT
ncbi:hypothetical protein C8R42DRAFT_637229 [Lentinula raphanica]|nr:hypothetical protein C8R42DRAFT_637229 [Lentinula raphanica]